MIHIEPYPVLINFVMVIYMDKAKNIHYLARNTARFYLNVN